MSLPRLKLCALIHNAAKWPLPGRALLGFALAGAVWVAGDLLCLSPSRERLHQAQAQEMALQEQVAQKTNWAARLEERNLQLLMRQEQIDRLLRQLPTEPQMPDLLEDIAGLALSNGLLIESVTPLEALARPLYSEQLLQVSAVGGYHDLAMFVSALGSLSRMVTTHDAVLRLDGRLLRLDLLAKTYWRGEQQGGWLGEPVAQASSFVYDSSGLRDPFQPIALQVDHAPGRSARAPDLERPRSLLEHLAIEQFEMVGTLSRGSRTFALLRSASTVHRLAIGDYLGPDHGRVTAIHDDHIELVELFPDKQGAWLERPRTLALNVNS